MSSPIPQLELFFDGECPLCSREISFLRKRDEQAQIHFVDISSKDFVSPGPSHEVLMARIHGRLPDGRWVEGPEVFRQVYELLGYRKWVAFSRWPVVRSALEVAYRAFAKNRLRLTGRCDAACRAPAPR